MKLLNLNIYRSKCIDAIIDYINEEQFDIVQLQEVGGKSFSFTPVDAVEEIEKRTHLRGEMFTMWYHKGRESGHFGNATFYKPSLILKERFDLRYRPFLEMEDPDAYPTKDHPKGALFLHLTANDTDF